MFLVAGFFIELLFEIVIRLVLWSVAAVFEIVAWAISRLFSGAPETSRRGKLRDKTQKKRAQLRVKRALRRGRCVLCKEDLGDDEVQGCDLCHTAVHPACARELLTPDAGCPTLGCGGSLHAGPAPPRPARARRRA